MSYSEIYREVELANYIITRTIGKKPEGFIAPGWSSSDKLLRVLNKIEYKYFSGENNGDSFRKYKRYMVYLFQKV